MPAGDSWLEAGATEIVIRLVKIGDFTIVKLEVYVERDGYIIAILEPVRGVDGDVNAGAGRHVINESAVLKQRLVLGGMVVDGVEAFEFRLWNDVFVGAVKEVDGLVAANLEDPTALAVDVVFGDAVRRGDEDDGLKPLNFL